MGMLVEARRDRQVEAFGIDISSYALQQVREDMKPFCRLGSLLDPLTDKYDFVVCIEVLEHLLPSQAERAITNICQASDDVLFLQPLTILKKLPIRMSVPLIIGPACLPGKIFLGIRNTMPHFLLLGPFVSENQKSRFIGLF